MNSIEQARFTPLFESLQRALKLQGKAKATKDAYSRAVRRVGEYFDRCPDDLSAEDLREYSIGTPTASARGATQKNIFASIGIRRHFAGLVQLQGQVVVRCAHTTCPLRWATVLR